MKSRRDFAPQLRLIAALLVLAVVGSQTAFAAGTQAVPVEGSSAAAGTGQAAAPIERVPAATAITVPAGTVVPLTLVSPIKSKSTKVGDTVRAQVAFPVTVGTQVAIPAGTYVEGAVTSLTSPKRAASPQVQIHFTRLVYANGYSVALDAANTQAQIETPVAAPVELAENDGPAALPGSRTVFYGGEGFAYRAQVTQPTLPPLPQVGPSKALVFGIMGGVVAALITLGFVFHHKAGNADFAMFDAGWQFQMALTAPLTVDAAQVAAAAGIPAR